MTKNHRFTMYQNIIYDEGQIINSFECMKLLNYFYDENIDLMKMNEQLREKNKEFKEENEQLKQRNDRQAKRLAELYELMAKKDWESLTEIIDDFCSCEEQLQRESRTYGDVE